MSDGTYFDLAVANARDQFSPRDRAFIDGIVEDVIRQHAKPATPLCPTCKVEMRRVKDDLYQCPRCMRIEVV